MNRVRYPLEYICILAGLRSPPSPTPHHSARRFLCDFRVHRICWGRHSSFSTVAPSGNGLQLIGRLLVSPYREFNHRQTTTKLTTFVPHTATSVTNLFQLASLREDAQVSRRCRVRDMEQLFDLVVGHG